MRRQDKESKVFKIRGQGVRSVLCQQARHERRVQRRRGLAQTHLEEYRAKLGPVVRQAVRLNVLKAIRDHFLKVEEKSGD